MGVLSDKIHFSSKEWKILVENELDGSYPEGRMMCCLARLPDIIQRGKKMLRRKCQDPNLLQEARSNYQKMMAILEEFLCRKVEMQKKIETEHIRASHARMIDAHYQRTYALGLSVSIMLNCVLCAIDIEDSSLLPQAEHFAKETVGLSKAASLYRPLGSSYMVLCLMAAWGGTTDHSIRLSIEKELDHYVQDFPHGQTARIVENVEAYFQHLRLTETTAVKA
jgi:hypothetical protein